MASLRDAKYVRTIAEANHFLPVSDEASRLILCTAETMLRNVLAQAAALARRFRKRRIQAAYVEMVVRDLNLDFLLSGCTEREPNRFVRAEAATWELDPAELSIQAAMQHIIEQKLRVPRPVGIYCDWLAFGGRAFGDRYGPAEPREPPRAAEPPARPPGEPARNGFVVKEISANVLSEEAHDFFKTLVAIVEEYFIYIDREQTHVNYQKWAYTLGILRHHPRLQVVSPFVVNFIIRSIELPIVNGFEKKSLFLDVVEALCNNPKVELEYYMHLLIHFLVKSLLSTRIATNATDREPPFRQKSALLLARLLARLTHKLRHQVPAPQAGHHEPAQRLRVRRLRRGGRLGRRRGLPARHAQRRLRLLRPAELRLPRRVLPPRLALRARQRRAVPPAALPPRGLPAVAAQDEHVALPRPRRRRRLRRPRRARRRGRAALPRPAAPLLRPPLPPRGRLPRRGRRLRRRDFLSALAPY